MRRDEGDRERLKALVEGRDWAGLGRNAQNRAAGDTTRSPTKKNRGRDRRCRRPPARIPACASTHWAPPLGSGVEAQVRPGMEDAGLG
jgi:hypothetical protein